MGVYDNSYVMYSRLLDSGNVTETLIARLVEMYKKDTNLNIGVKLLTHRQLQEENLLTEEQAEEICKAGGAEELIAWIGRAGRTSEEIIKKVKTEKRVAVLAKLATRDDLPTEIFETLVKASKNPEVLADIVSNESVPEDLREKAARKAFDSAVKSKQTDSVRYSKMDTILNACTVELRSKLAIDYADHHLVMLRITGRHMKVDEQVTEMYRTKVWELVEKSTEKLETAIATALAENPNSHPAIFVTGSVVETHVADGIGEIISVLSKVHNGEISDAQTALLQRLEAALAQNNQASWGWSTVGRVKRDIEVFIVEKELEAEAPLSEITNYKELSNRIQQAISAVNAGGMIDWSEYILHEFATIETSEQCGAIGIYHQDQVIKTLLEQDRYPYAAQIVIHLGFSSPDDVVKLVADDRKQELFDLLNDENLKWEQNAGRSNVRIRRDLFLTGIAPIDFLLDCTTEDLNQMGPNYVAAVWPLVEQAIGDSPEAWTIFETLIDDGEIPIGLAAQSASVI